MTRKEVERRWLIRGKPLHIRGVPVTSLSVDLVTWSTHYIRNIYIYKR